MSFIIDTLLGAGKRVGLSAGKSAIGGTFRRAALGAAIGGGYEAITSDSQNTGSYLSDIARGALIGGTIGAASRLVTPALVRGKFKGPGILSLARKAGYKPTLKKFAKKGYQVSKFGIKGGMNLALFAAEHPIITVAGATLGVYALFGNKAPYSSPSSDVNLKASYNQEARALDRMETGIAPQGGLSTGIALRQNRLQQSTMGMVQGMWQSRH